MVLLHDQASRRDFISDSEAETRNWAARLVRQLEGGELICLQGDLGAGKTFLVRAMCEALNVPREAGVSSPSYSLMQLYRGGRLPVAHLDLYRLGDEDELESMGFRDVLGEDFVVFVEWPERAPSLQRMAHWWVAIEDLGPQKRSFTLTEFDPGDDD
jgi:tRNA threonylcarbamoyl adenosine modification protein YjeE